MQQQFDIAPTRKAADINQAELADAFGIHAAALAAVEDGRIGIDSNTYDAIHGAIRTIAARKKEATECNRDSQGMASAAT